jgi:integrase
VQKLYPPESQLSRRVLNQTNDNPYAFPKYCSDEGHKTNSASAALNKWLKAHTLEECVVHSFRHSMRDRLRAAECPFDVVDQIGGWATAGVGSGYGRGYTIEVLGSWMQRIE